MPATGSDHAPPRTHLCSPVESGVKVHHSVHGSCLNLALDLVGYRRRAPTSDDARVLRISPTKPLHHGTEKRQKVGHRQTVLNTDHASLRPLLSTQVQV
jgi:hypothetical protein